MPTLHTKHWLALLARTVSPVTLALERTDWERGIRITGYDKHGERNAGGTNKCWEDSCIIRLEGHWVN